jgi:hypothetical protein
MKTERRRKPKAAQKSQKKSLDFLFCDLCETFATSAFGPRSRIQRCNS